MTGEVLVAMRLNKRFCCVYFFGTDPEILEELKEVWDGA